ncbi:patatin-like phospholipase family protein [Methylorubrum extorquens]|uniref:patatin-like phospholipase family protein n=1 Tax=Methylorubrum extorquens TaxID=408 RepID=UPI002238036D|nr:patatin-like phospholipase family protein [Methylorubrum extorquens]UYW28250.1 patatin-like phospholipase family protein [Methylorubrum extorquens]
MVLSGGNALGAYHAGVYEVLHERGIRPDWVVGASMGAVTAAIVAGNAPEGRVAKLRQFWDEATQHTAPSVSGMLKPRQVYNGLHALTTLAWGRPNIFQHRWPGLWSALPGVPNDVAMFDHAPLLASINRFVDFDRLNQGDIRVTIGCVDVASGEEVYFDTAHGTVRAEHVLASTSLLPAFPPVEIDGRLLCDLGYTNNLPLDPLFANEPKRDLLCIASDLFNLRAPRPDSLDAVLERANDLIFASAGRRAISALEREYTLRQRLEPNGPAVMVLHVVYKAAADQLSAKSFDFSPSPIRDRWAAGGRDMIHGLARLADRASHGRRFVYEAV